MVSEPSIRTISYWQKEMIYEALELGGKPCGSRKLLRECFTYERSVGVLMLWYNDPHGDPPNTTRLISRFVGVPRDPKTMRFLTQRSAGCEGNIDEGGAQAD